jgi:hypothetical protein
VTTVIADAIANLLKAVVAGVSQHYGISESDAKVVVLNKIIDIAALVGVGTATLYSKLGVKAAAYLGLDAAGKKGIIFFASTEAKIAAADANPSLIATAGSTLWKAITAIPATKILMWLVFFGNVGDWFFFKTNLFAETLKNIFGIDISPTLAKDAPPAGFALSEFNSYATSIEAAGVVGINSVQQQQEQLYTRDNLKLLLEWLYGQQLQNNAGLGIKTLEQAAQKYLIFKDKASAAPSTPAPAKSQATTFSVPKVFTGIISQGAVASATSFTPRPDDLITSANDLQTAIANNVAPFIAALPGKLIYEVKMQTTVTTKDGFTQHGTTQQIQTGTYKDGSAKYKTVTNRFAVLNLYILSDLNHKSKIAQIVLGPTDAAQFQPTQNDLSSIEQTIASTIMTDTPPTTVAAATAQPLATDTASDAAPVATPLAPWQKLPKFTGNIDSSYLLPRDGFAGELYHLVGKTLYVYTPADELVTDDEKHTVGNFGAQSELARQRLLQLGVDINRFSLAPFIADIITQNKNVNADYKSFFGFTDAPTPTQPTQSTTTTATDAITTLYGWYASKGQSLPPVASRATTYAQLGLGPANYYTGTAEQNTKLLAALKAQ